MTNPHPQVQTPNPPRRPAYVAVEPEPITMWRDTRGKFHAARETAIAANFEHDLQRQVRASTAAVDPDSPWPDSEVTAFFIRHFVHHNPDMVRVLLGDRDAT